MPDLGAVIRRRFPFHEVMTGEFFLTQTASTITFAGFAERCTGNSQSGSNPGANPSPFSGRWSRTPQFRRVSSSLCRGNCCPVSYPGILLSFFQAGLEVTDRFTQAFSDFGKPPAPNKTRAMTRITRSSGQPIGPISSPSSPSPSPEFPSPESDLDYLYVISAPACNPFLIESFQERYRILACHTKQGLKIGHGKAFSCSLQRPDLLLQFLPNVI